MSNPRLPSLGKRLALAARLGGGSRVFADIGTDHGILAAHLLCHDEEAFGLLSDLSPLALEKARARIHRLGLERRALMVAADGLDALEVLGEKKAQTVYILGMGGDTLAGILKRGAGRLDGETLVLSAHTELPLLREVVYSIGYFIEKEEIAREDNRFYFLLKCRPGRRETPSDKELFLSPFLLGEKPEEWRPYLEKQRRLHRENIAAMEKSGGDEPRLPLFRKRLCWLEEALEGY